LIKNHDDGSTELYDLSKDIGETHNLALQKPKVAADLKNRLEHWLKSSHAAMPRKVTTAKTPVKPRP
jgi:hypothetical protein